MAITREIHPDFWNHLKYKDQELIDVYSGLRNFILDLYPESCELLYHTHALTSVYSVSEKMGDAFCMIPIYTNHLNLGFNKGVLLPDPKKLLQGTGKHIRHIPIKTHKDYNKESIKNLILSAVEFSKKDSTIKTKFEGQIISKIK
ncbi:DUF1801 domain-containing protein [Winogradskyella immobilis]|uniref:DUF1801 domain-containing protein n=1 Tax=Winogradskyella immobilis TaxID=2816852 RepID=A0ABS8END6_9FLAO|nr:DUF1801 domain-containing protein [Winogradskyella immobilis]MCC1484372.1 DUF1801 domain-containing protein [Winogradskyella immobilis]MCG0016464.1 DUF1801 domain-containing protein [Winogradskyella immobilis]